MARPLSEEKREAILSAATSGLARLGPTLSTSNIAREAGVSEGTVFVYFESKDELFRALYLELKTRLRDHVAAGMPRARGTLSKVRHMFNRLIDWHVENAEAGNAMAALTASGRLDSKTITAGNAPYEQLYSVLRDGIRNGELRDQPIPFIGGLLQAIADLTVARMLGDPQQSTAFRRLGWQALKGAIGRNQ
jgi:AcrR family transcriptional regulator